MMFSAPTLSFNQAFVSMTSILNTYFNTVDSQDTIHKHHIFRLFKNKWKVKILSSIYAYFPVVNAYHTVRVESVLPES